MGTRLGWYLSNKIKPHFHITTPHKYIHCITRVKLKHKEVYGCYVEVVFNFVPVCLIALLFHFFIILLLCVVNLSITHMCTVFMINKTAFTNVNYLHLLL